MHRTDDIPDSLQEVLLDILDGPSAQRHARLDAWCTANPAHAAAAARWMQRALTGEDAVWSAPTAERLARLRARPRFDQERYRIEGRIAMGGMGEILRVQDQDLRRALAMKVIRSKVEGDATRTGPTVDPQLIERFLDEAQIMGQLDHPGVVPVYELGLDADDQAYFLMRLVKGTTAGDVFRLARDGKEGWTQTKALEVILKVCDVMAYAHAKDVLHRDLKPANIMVGRYGEVYVMDWGLAKVMGEADRRDLRLRPASDASQSRVRSDRARAVESDPGSPLVTMDGDVVGTPSYMPPEQAEGRVEEIGPRSDVYAVGAILYTLLTGQQPYVRPGARMSPRVILAAVCSGQPTPIHAVDPSVPAELAAVCERAMARAPDDRYQDMRALADDLRAYLGNRVVQAYRTGALAEMQAWVRRNRGLAASLAAVFVVALGAALGMSMLAASAQDAAAHTRVAEQAAQRRFQQVRELARFVVFSLDDDLLGLPGSTLARRKVVAEALSYLDALRAEVGSDPQLMLDVASAYLRLGVVHGANAQANLGDYVGAAKSHRRALELFEQVAKALPAEPRWVAGMVHARAYLGALELKAKRAVAAEEHCRLGLEILARHAASAARADSVSVPEAHLHNVLGDLHSHNDQPEASTRAFERVLAIRRSASTPVVSASDTTARMGVGDALLATGATDQALAEFTSARDDARQASENRPLNVALRRSVAVLESRCGNALLALGRLPEAIDAQQRSLDALLRIERDDPANTQAKEDAGITWRKLAELHARRGDRQAASAALRESLARFVHCMDSGQDPGAVYQVASVESKLGYSALNAGEVDEAETTFNSLVRRCRALVAEDGNNPAALEELAAALRCLGDIDGNLAFPGRQRPEAARAPYQEALALSRRVVELRPWSAKAKDSLGTSLERLAGCCTQMDQLDEAHALVTELVAVSRALCVAVPNRGEHRRGLSIALEKLGDLQRRQGRPDAAVASYRESMDVGHRAPREDDAHGQRDLAVMHYKLGTAHAECAALPAAAPEGRRSDLREAIARFSKARDGLLRMQERGILAPHDRQQIERMEAKVAECTARLRDLP